MSDERASRDAVREGPLTLDALAAVQHVQPLRSAADLLADVWESDDELDRFVASVREDRRADRA